ncbi:Formyltransferase [Myriangium duriaei CBS 260.36]|uniref:methionyl-tRNA formyltransferase n=1 Tax=Myriangium duriaei CBS 260.36 TaxID=1168546 RepID=A0A9P4MMX7_9PEZI|nr:Formyltransferase [Myriangium duriaei CBS 260.36]
MVIVRGGFPKWAHISRTKYYSTQTKISPLRILFCGSDEFSIFSLRALTQLPPDVVESIDVVCRTPKRTGRGYKKLTYPPIHHVAESFSLPIHHIPTFTGWIPPSPFDLIIAVSFGLLVPPRILSLTRYGGLNVHPSLLPDLHGPAPIHWALLHGETHSGVTLQTLHPQHFDQGTILDQTSPPGTSLRSQDGTPLSLPASIDALGHAGAEMLARNIQSGSFASPPSTRESKSRSNLPPRHAPKLKTADARLDNAWTSSQLLARDAVLGPLWDDVTSDALKSLAADAPWHRQHTGWPRSCTRIQYGDWRVLDDTRDVALTALTHVRSGAVASLSTGPEVLVTSLDGVSALAFRCSDGKLLAPGKVKVEGSVWKPTQNLVGMFV